MTDPYPEHAIMVSFLAMARAHGLDTETGVLLAYIPDAREPDGYRTHEIPGEHVDELVRRGWVELQGEDVIEASEAGIYHLNRWRERQEKAEQRARRAR